MRGLIFVDSGIPARAGDTAFVPPALLDQFRALADDGILPPWSSWFGEDAMRELVPDEVLRHALEREMPRLPLAFLEQRIPTFDSLHVGAWVPLDVENERRCGRIVGR